LDINKLTHFVKFQFPDITNFVISQYLSKDVDNPKSHFIDIKGVSQQFSFIAVAHCLLYI